MRFSTPLLKGRLVKRYKRFLADVILDETSEVVTAHCPNTGSMESCGLPGDPVLLSHAPSHKRKLDYTWEFTVVPTGLIGVNTALPNKIVAEGIKAGDIPELAGYQKIKAEYRLDSGSRIDFHLSEHPEKKAPCLVEVKNVTLLKGRQLLFPDAQTIRGLRHIEDLMAARQKGSRAVMFYLINRPEGDIFQIAWKIDPKYGAMLAKAIELGLEVLAYRTISKQEGIHIGNAVPFSISRA